jgi:hypothetical protein
MEMPAVGKWVLKGYQADADFGDRFTGNIHEERGRNVIVSRGQAVRITDDQQYKSLGTIAMPLSSGGMLKTNDWNQYHIIGRGPMLMQFLNGRLGGSAHRRGHQEPRPRRCSWFSNARWPTLQGGVPEHLVSEAVAANRNFTPENLIFSLCNSGLQRRLG